MATLRVAAVQQKPQHASTSRTAQPAGPCSCRPHRGAPPPPGADNRRRPRAAAHRGSVRAAAADTHVAEASFSKDDGVKAAKQRLLSSVAGTERGSVASPLQRGLVEEAQVAVEALSGGQELDFSLLEGRWLLVYTTASDVLPLVAPPRLPSPLQIGRIYQAFTGREGSGSVQNIIEARLAGPPGFADLDAGVTLVVDAGWEARTARSIALAFREAGVQDVVLSPGLQNLLASPILPRGWWNQQLLLAIKQLSLRVPLTTRLPTAASSQALPAGLNYMLTHLDDDMLIGRAQGNGGTFIFTREAAPLKDASREA